MHATIQESQEYLGPHGCKVYIHGYNRDSWSVESLRLAQSVGPARDRLPSAAVTAGEERVVQV